MHRIFNSYKELFDLNSQSSSFVGVLFKTFLSLIDIYANINILKHYFFFHLDTILGQLKVE